LENEECQGQYLHADDLQEIVMETGTSLDFVFMASCHSEFAAKIFLNAGTRHVIGIDKSKKISD